MPGMPVYQDSPSSLKNQIYATDGSNVINIKADNTGRLTVATDATAPLEVSVNQTDDSILIYGNDGTDNQVLKTNATGQLDIRPLTDADTVSVVITEANDSITIYGNDGTDNKVLKTNATGQLDIRPLTDADTVSVIITEASDSILIYGNDGTDNKVLKTDNAGVLQVNYTPAFVDVTVVDAQATANAYTFSDGQDISNSTAYAFFVNNTGLTNSATVKIQLSPDDVTWVDDGDEVVVAEGTATIITANKFLKYIRIGYQSATADASTTITAIFQAQGQ